MVQQDRHETGQEDSSEGHVGCGSGCKQERGYGFVIGVPPSEFLRREDEKICGDRVEMSRRSKELASW